MGLQFHETGYGKRFFDSQLPALIKALNRLADVKQAEQPTPFPLADEATQKRLSVVMEDSEKAEAFAKAFFDAITSDDEAYDDIGFHMARAILHNNIEELLVAVSGWSSKSLLNIAEYGTAEPEEV